MIHEVIKCVVLQLSLINWAYAVSMRILAFSLLFPALVLASEIFTRDGVTDGDTFYLAPAATFNNDPVYQSWVAYSLMKSACQLKIGGENPARVSSFDCELLSRERLLDAWDEKRQDNADVSDDYLDTLSEVRKRGVLAEYTAHYFKRTNWQLPPRLRLGEFDDWRRTHLRGHKPLTRIIGSWNYREKVEEAAKR